MSRRRQGAEKARRTCEEEERGEPGSYKRENPGSMRSKKLSRGRKAGGAHLSSPASPSISSRSQREEVTSSNKRTPQFVSNRKPWDINSPSRDADQHHEIFWDPHSPTCFKLENGKKKTGNKCVVEISDIVNRIAPKDGTPTNSDASYFGVWIGDDAIPCTPVVTRTRTKMHRSRILKTEDELMELAKQLDRNLVEHKEQKKDLIEKAHTSNNVDGVHEDDDGSFLEYIPEEDEVSEALKSVSQSSGVAAEHNSQKSVDREAEDALNALFDSSTQKCSGRFSQTSHVSTSSIQEIGNRNGKNQLLTKDKGSVSLALISDVNSDMLQRDKCKQAVAIGKEPVQPSAVAHSASNIQDDFEDDWGDDILEDDSFVMQVTQNPELIATPKSNLTSNTAKNIILDTVRGKDGTGSTAKVTSSKLNSFKFVSRKINEVEGNKMGTSDPKKTETSNVKRIEESTRNRPTSITHPPGAQVAKQNATDPKSSTNPPANSGVSKTYTFSSKASISRKENELTKKGIQPAQQTQAVSKTKESVYADEWDDPKFSDEVLDMFCESDSLWDDKDDDDDLLYQVCDNVERLTQAQVSEQSTQLFNSSHNFSTKSGQNKTETQTITNYSFPSNKSSGSVLSSNKSFGKAVSPAFVSGNCSNSFQYSAFQKTNPASATFIRSNSMPSVVESKRCHEPPSQRVNNPQPAPTNAKASNAPSKYSFTRTKPSSSLTSLTGNDCTSKGPQGCVENNKRNPHMQPLVHPSQQASLKRHLSESTIHSSKVFVSEDRSKKCSMEEIERKKQEALARRKMKERLLSSDSAPT